MPTAKLCTPHWHKMIPTINVGCCPLSNLSGGNPLYPAIPIRPIRPLVCYSQQVNAFHSYVSVNSNWVHPPPGNPRENCFERANPGHPGNFFCLIPCPGAKNDGRIPGGGAKFFQTRRNCSLSLQKILKKLRKLRDSTNFLFGEFNKTFIF